MNRFTVRTENTLLPFLSASLKGSKRGTLKNLLKFKNVFVNGKPVTQFNHPLAAGDQIEIRKPRGIKQNFYPFEIVFEDDEIIVIDKLAGWLTIATDKVEERTIYYQLNEYLKQTSPSRRKQLFIVHRLDKEVSGLLVFAKTAEAKEILQSNWRQAVKRYFAVVEGKPKQAEGTIASYLSENQFLKVYSGPKTPESKYAVTHYRLVRSNTKFSLVELELETGRKHQLRVHLADLGCPIVGDKKYGAKTKVPKASFNDARRLALHAHYLAFTHPLTGKRMVFESKEQACLFLVSGDSHPHKK